MTLCDDASLLFRHALMSSALALKRPSFFNLTPVTGWTLLGYFLLASNIAAEKWLLGAYDFKEINFATASLIMLLTALQEGVQKRSLRRLAPKRWQPLVVISLCTLVAWTGFVYSLIGLSMFEYGAMSLLSPLVMGALAIVMLKEQPPKALGVGLALGLMGGLLLVKGEWNGVGEWQYHLFMLLSLFAASFRWILVKRIGEGIPTSALIFWEPLMVLIAMGLMIDFQELWTRLELSFLSAAFLLFLSRQCLVRSYQAQDTTATSVAALIYTKLGWTLLFGFLIWGTVPAWSEWLGVLLIVAGSWVVLRRSA